MCTGDLQYINRRLKIEESQNEEIFDYYLEKPIMKSNLELMLK